MKNQNKQVKMTHSSDKETQSVIIGGSTLEEHIFNEDPFQRTEFTSLSEVSEEIKKYQFNSLPFFEKLKVKAQNTLPSSFFYKFKS